MNFSQRNGYIKLRDSIQRDELDKETRTRIWNIFFNSLEKLLSNALYCHSFTREYWTKFLKAEIDQIPKDVKEYIKQFKHYFLISEFNKSFDFIEFYLSEISRRNLSSEKRLSEIKIEILKRYNLEELSPDKIEFNRNLIAEKNHFDKHQKEYDDYLKEYNELKHELNKILEEEKVAYRFVNGIFAEIDSESQIKEIENLMIELEEKNLLTSKSHFNKAFESLYHREKFNYKNSIIESIQFLEALLSFKLNKENGKAQLGDLIAELNKDNFQNSDFEKDVLDMFFKIYGKLSNSGVRHGKEKFEILIEPSFSQAKLIFNLANSLASYLLTSEFSFLENNKTQP